ncbi:MAG: hypothetical protein J2O48_09465, partial [Solirubrobacterales bacterium]|nr:hypothetical protein [Solirubrobacterales bacterium]
MRFSLGGKKNGGSGLPPGGSPQPNGGQQGPAPVSDDWVLDDPNQPASQSQSQSNEPGQWDPPQGGYEPPTEPQQPAS